MKLVVLLLCIVYIVHSSTVVRTNSFGFLPQSQKTAVVLSTTQLSNVRFSVFAGSNAVFSSSSVTSSAKWNSQYAYTYQLDFSSVQTIGNFTIQLYDAQGNVIASTPFTITTTAAYNQLIENSLFYYRAQRDGSNIDPSVLQRKASHLTDQSAYVYTTPSYSNEQLVGTLQRTAGPIDVSGGYFDAGDYLKFVQTTSFVVSLMSVTLRDYAPDNANLKNEVLHGINWLLKMWDDNNGILYFQVGIGDGNSKTLGDHDLWRLPEADDKLNPSPGSSNYYIKYRPVFATNNSISPNLAGRMAGAFALCNQIFKGVNDTLANQCLNSAKHIYAQAKTIGVSMLTTTVPFDYYPEAEWRDDMEFGAIELYKATFAINYLQDAATYASAYITSASEKGMLNLYDIAGLAHYELHKIISVATVTTSLAVTKDKLLSDRKQLLDAALRASNADPFHLGDAYNSGDDLVPFAFGLWLESSFYNELTQSSTYQNLATQQSNWVFGQNAWGTSFIVGAGPVFPHCLQHQVANLVGGLNGTGNILLGAVVDGPSQTDNFSGLGVPDGAKRCNWNVFSAYDGKGVKYIDNVTSWPSSEPANDYTVMSLLAFARTAKIGI